MKNKLYLQLISTLILMLFTFEYNFAQDEEIAKYTIEYKNDIVRGKNETAQQLAMRLKPPKEAFQHPVLEFPFLEPKSGKDILVCIADTTLTEEVPLVIIQLLSPWEFEKKVYYQPVFVTAIEHGAEGMAQIDAAFLANADKDTAKELIILFRTNIRKYNVATNSWYIQDYSEVAIFDNKTDACYHPICLDELELVEKKFKPSKTAYTAKSVKTKLKAMGFKN